MPGAVGWPVATGFDFEWSGAVDRLLLVCHVGVQVDVGGRDLLVSFSGVGVVLYGI